MSRSGNVESAEVWFSRTAISEQWSSRLGLVFEFVSGDCFPVEFHLLKQLTTLSECSRQLADQTGEWHIQRAIQSTGFRTRVVFEHFDGNGGIITHDYASLNHAHQAGDALGFAERAGCVDDRIGIVANPSRKDRGQSQTDFG